METDYQHTPISMEQLHQAMQTSLNASSIVHNFQLPLSPRQMSTLMLKTNHLSRNLSFNEIPADRLPYFKKNELDLAHLPRNLAEIDLAQNLAHDLPQNLRHEDLILSQNLGRNLDLTLARNISNELELQNNLAQSLVQNLNEQELARSLSNDMSRINEVLPQNLRSDLPHNLSHEIDLSHHLNRANIEQEILNQEESRRSQMVVLQDHLLDQNLSRLDQNIGSRLDQNIGSRLVNSNISLHDSQRQIEQNDHLLPMPFHIKSEQEDEYFYDNINQGLNVNGLNGKSYCIFLFFRVPCLLLASFG